MPEARSYKIQIRKSAKKVLARLPQDLFRRLTAAISALAFDPRPMGYKKLAGEYDSYRIRVGDWRITYTIQDEILLVTVVEVAPRGGAYRNL
jgi:mRNA interferase RelE/StbE